jgi:hypothetical protein
MHSSSTAVHRHSGRLGTSLFLLPVGAVIATMLLSIAYAYVTVYSPIVGYVSLLFLVFYGFGLGWAVSKVGFIAKCRNTVLLRVTGLVSGLVALYVSWATFEYALLNRYDESFTASLADVLASPVAVFEIARTLNADGWYTVVGITPAGTMLWVLWGIEAVVVVAAPLLLATMAIDDQVFCETCGEWCRSTASTVRLTVPENESHFAGLGPGNVQPLISLPVAHPGENQFIRIDTWECEKCRNTAAMQAKMAARVANDQGKIEEKTQDLTSIWNITPGILKQIQSLNGQSGHQQSGGLN